MKIWKYLLILLFPAFIAGCSFTPTQTEKDIGSIVVNNLIVKAVNSTRDPVKTRDNMLAGIDVAESLLAGNPSEASADKIVDALYGQINFDKMAPEDAGSLMQIKPMIKRDLVERFGIQATSPLTPEQAASIKEALDNLKVSLSFIKG